ncbi:MAG: hypothetical protein LBT97_04650 [Planctomycetota bacterium]|jgi:hypothetical protein|nr:hypothetical protein [Planctomycetota bacterium]
MDEETRLWFATPLATLLLCGAVAIFLLGYIPEAKKARECEAKVEEARMRINELAIQEMRARQRIAEIEAGDPVAIEEAIREVLRLGGKHDFLPRE